MRKQSIEIPNQDVISFETKLKSKFSKQISVRYLFWVCNEQAVNKFYGSVGNGKFRLIPLIPGRNFFTPVFSGSYIQHKTSMNVVVHFQNSPITQGAYLSFLSAIVLIFMRLMLDLLQAHTFNADILPALFAFTILLVVLFLTNRYFKKKIIQQFWHFERWFPNAKVLPYHKSSHSIRNSSTY